MKPTHSRKKCFQLEWIIDMNAIMEPFVYIAWIGVEWNRKKEIPLYTRVMKRSAVPIHTTKPSKEKWKATKKKYQKRNVAKHIFVIVELGKWTTCEKKHKSIDQFCMQSIKLKWLNEKRNRDTNSEYKYNRAGATRGSMGINAARNNTTSKYAGKI